MRGIPSSPQALTKMFVGKVHTHSVPSSRRSLTNPLTAFTKSEHWVRKRPSRVKDVRLHLTQPLYPLLERRMRREEVVERTLVRVAYEERAHSLIYLHLARVVVLYLLEGRRETLRVA